jgi:hypothetical protein
MSWIVRGQMCSGKSGEGGREPLATGHVLERRDPRHFSPFFGWAIFAATIAQIAGRDYAEVGAANAQEAGKIRFIGHARGWAAVAALLLVVLAVFSWTNLLYVLLFLIGSVACAILALGLHLTRPIVDPE